MPTANKIRLLRPSTAKMLIVWDYPSDPSITLDTVDFHVEYYTTNIRQKVTIKKEELIREEVTPEEGPSIVNWYAYVKTGLVSAGDLKIRLWAEIPDADAPDGVKVEYTECPTNVTTYD